jgi:hypothetical protein
VRLLRFSPSDKHQFFHLFWNPLDLGDLLHWRPYGCAPLAWEVSVKYPLSIGIYFIYFYCCIFLILRRYRIGGVSVYRRIGYISLYRYGSLGTYRGNVGDELSNSFSLWACCPVNKSFWPGNLFRLQFSCLSSELSFVYCVGFLLLREIYLIASVTSWLE